MEPTPQPDENVELIREPVAIPKAQVVAEDGDRSPTKTERDVETEAAAKVEASSADEGSVVRNLVLPVSQAEDEEGDRSPTKTERGLAQDAISPAQKEVT